MENEKVIKRVKGSKNKRQREDSHTIIYSVFFFFSTPPRNSPLYISIFLIEINPPLSCQIFGAT